jgi:hypothetical protein
VALKPATRVLASLLEALIREVLIQAFFFRGEPLKENEVFLGEREAGRRAGEMTQEVFALSSSNILKQHFAE